MTFDFFYGRQAEQFTFYRVPKSMFTDERFKSLSLEAKVMYGILLDRMSLSAKNGWLDQKGRVYIIFTINEAVDMLGYATEKTVRILSELEEIGLIAKYRQGHGKPNLIYVKNFVSCIGEGKERKEADKECGSSGSDSPASGTEDGIGSEGMAGGTPDHADDSLNFENRNSSQTIENSTETLNFENRNSRDEAMNFENRNSRISKIEIHEFRKSKCNNTDRISNTEGNDGSVDVQHTSPTHYTGNTVSRSYCKENNSDRLDIPEGIRARGDTGSPDGTDAPGDRDDARGPEPPHSSPAGHTNICVPGPEALKPDDFVGKVSRTALMDIYSDVPDLVNDVLDVVEHGLNVTGTVHISGNAIPAEEIRRRFDCITTDDAAYEIERVLASDTSKIRSVKALVMYRFYNDFGKRHGTASRMIARAAGKHGYDDMAQLNKDIDALAGLNIPMDDMTRQKLEEAERADSERSV